jgi:hypothetical protein
VGRKVQGPGFMVKAVRRGVRGMGLYVLGILPARATLGGGARSGAQGRPPPRRTHSLRPTRTVPAVPAGA